MKKYLLLFTAVILSTGSLLAETTMKKEITDTFSDKIKNIQENKDELKISFQRHAAFYKMPKSNPKYDELKTKLEKLKKEEKKVKIVAVIPAMEIKEVTE